MQGRRPNKSLLSLAITALIATNSQIACASGFQLFEGNTVNIGDFVSGITANPVDASTGTYNPAGLPQIGHTELVNSGVGVFTDNQFEGQAAWRLAGPAPFPYFENGTSQGGAGNLVPAFHLSKPLNEHIAISLNVTSPFGLETDYSNAAITRYAATDSRLLTINVSPAIGLRLNQNVAVGAGIDYQYADVDFDSYAGLPGVVGTSSDSLSRNKGESWAWSWHAGVLLYSDDDTTRVGITYHPAVTHFLKGRSTLNGPLALNAKMKFISETLNAKITLPATTSIGGFHRINDDWAVMASVIYTEWSVFKNITLKDVAGINAATMSNAKIDVVAPQNFHDTVRFSVGGQWHYSETLTLRCGAGFETTPTTDTDRSVRLPDEDRFAIALGAHYQATPVFGMDFGYTHFIVKEATINNTTATGSQIVTTQGRVRNNADLIGLQVSMNVDKFMAAKHA